MANGMNSVPSLERISGQISEISENVGHLYRTRCELYEDLRHTEVAAISVEIERWERRLEQLKDARARMRQHAEAAAAREWVEVQARWAHAASVA